MASALKLKNDIRKLKTAIDNKATNPKFLPKLKEQLAKLEDDLAKLKKPSKSGKKPYVRAEGSALTKLKNKLKGIEKKYKGYSGKTPLSLERDANRPAKPIGKRKAKSGNTYYEYRANRIDVKQPPKVFPKLEDGGYMADGGKLKSGVYRVGKPNKVSKNLYEQKIVEIFDNGDIATASDYGRNLSDFKSYSYPIISSERLEKEYKMEEGGYMSKGGETTPYIVWVSKDGEKREYFGEYKSQRAAEMAMKKLWEKGEYDAMGNRPKSTYEKEGLYEKGGYMAEGGETAKFEVDDVVYHKGHNTIGIVRMAEERGEVKTDADGNVNVSELEYYNPLKHESHKNAEIAPSTSKEIEERMLWKPFSERASQLREGGYMAKGGIYSSDDRWVVTFQNQDSGEYEKVIVRANNKKNAIDIAEDESGLGSDWQYYSAEKEMASGGYMAKGGKLSLKKFREKYDDNEDRNYHSENVVLLAENFGSDSDIRDAKIILAKHEAIGSLPYNLSQERNALHDKLWAKYKEATEQSKEDGGYMADGGESQGYDDREDERLAMEHGKISTKDFVGTHSEKEHSRRDDARFEERKMAMGGVAEHGLMKGDHIVDTLEDTLVIENGGKKYYVFIKTGEREEVAEKGGYMTHGGETHRSEKNKK